jgi:hypothetical protein
VLVDGDRAVSFWWYPALAAHGWQLAVKGVDVFTLVDGKVAR